MGKGAETFGALFVVPHGADSQYRIHFEKQGFVQFVEEESSSPGRGPR